MAGRAVPRAPEPVFVRLPCGVARAVPRAPNPAVDCGPSWLVAPFPAPLKASVLVGMGIFSLSGV
ncbi:hypothetical protein GCM10022284_36110 [Streptomyces hundungensis]